MAKQSTALLEKRDKVLTRAEEITALAETEKRDITADEDTEIKTSLDSLRDLDEQIERHLELEARSEKAAQVRKETGVNPVTAVVKEPRTYAPKAKTSFIRDAYNAQFNHDSAAQGRLDRHMAEERIERRDVTSAAFAGLMVPQFLTELATPFARAGRPFANVVRKLNLPDEGLTLSISRVTTGTATASQTEGAAVQETDIDDTKLDVSVITISGMQDVSRQAIERGTSVDELVMGDLVSAYHTNLDSLLVAQLLSAAGQTVTYTDASPTVAEVYPKLLDATQKVQTTFFAGPDVMLMHPRRLAWFLAAVDSTGRPLAVPTMNGPNNAIGAGEGGVQYGNSRYSIAGYPVITDANVSILEGAGVNEDTIFIGNSQTVLLWEQGDGEPMMLRFEQTKAAELEITIVVYGYAAFTAGRQPNGFARIGGTGLITPTF